MQEEWQVELVDSLQQARNVKDEWDELFSEVKQKHPSLQYEWFALWYSLFEPKSNVRILLLRQKDGLLRAVFPGFVHTRRFFGLNLRCFSYAADGYSPCGGIIARDGDQEAVRAVIEASMRVIRPEPHLVVLPEIFDTSDTALVLGEGGLAKTGLRVEHAKEVSFVSLEAGWEHYYAAQSSKRRSLLKKRLRQLNTIGQFEITDISSVERSAEGVDRLQRLDAITWQGQQGTGLFSTLDNERFYGRLLSYADTKVGAQVSFATVDSHDIAYVLSVRTANVCCALKWGYDPQYAQYSPGSLTIFHVLEQAASEGMKIVDLGPGINEEKRRWETHRQWCRNWWLFNRWTFRGRLLESASWLHDLGRKKNKDVGQDEC